MLRSHLIIVLILVIFAFAAFFYWDRKHCKPKTKIKQEPSLNPISHETTEFEDESTVLIAEDIVSEDQPELTTVTATIDAKKVAASNYDPNTIIMQLHATPGRPFMGYELLQTLATNELNFGDRDMFHRHERADGVGPILFSLAAATKTGTFDIHNMGAFSCGGLVMFMHLTPKKKLMRTFDLMLDTARQIIEDLGGEILNELDQPVDANVIKEWRDRVCAFDEKIQYNTDLLDNL